jgi:hypothetical protein
MESHLHKEFKMNVLEIGRVSAETKTTASAIQANDASPLSYSPARFCIDNRAGGSGKCEEVFQDGKVAVSLYTGASDCQSSPGKFTNCVP